MSESESESDRRIRVNGDTFVVEFFRRIFSFLEKVSITYALKCIIRHFVDDRLYGFIDAIVLLFFIVSLINLILSIYFPYSTINIIIIFLSCIRVFEIIIYQANVILFHAINSGEFPFLRSYIRSVILVVINYIEIIIWFSGYYIVFAAIGDLKIENYIIISSIRESIVAMVANSTGAFSFTSSIPIIVVTLQTLIGLFMTLIVLAYFISLLPRRPTMDEGERGAAGTISQEGQ